MDWRVGLVSCLNRLDKGISGIEHLGDDASVDEETRQEARRNQVNRNRPQVMASKGGREKKAKSLEMQG